MALVDTPRIPSPNPTTSPAESTAEAARETSPGKLAPFSATGLKLFLLGFATLFLELLFIRYLAGSIWNLGYFPNLVLLSVFIGMGVGFVFHDRIGDQRSGHVFIGGFGLAVALILFVSTMHPVVPGFTPWHYNLGGDLYFSVVPFKVNDLNYFFFVLCFVMVAATFTCISQRTAKLFRQFAPLDAYTLDILGSVAGILSFIAISALHLPAWSWFTIFTIIFLCAMDGPMLMRAIPAGLAVLAIIFMVGQDLVLMQKPDSNYLKEAIWSPYQKIEYAEVPDPNSGVIRHIVYANGLNHQEILLAPEKQFYGIPYLYREKVGLPPTKSVLVIGAGTANDVTTALRNGATHVDAVEIDPVIAQIGREHNPSGAYSDPRVDLHINDGRAFMTQTHQKYDLIIFALTDSLVKVSSLSQLRLENYLFTRESIERAYSLLNDDGNIVFYNYYRLPFVAQKIYNMAYLVSGTQPKVLAQQADFFMLCAQKTPGSVENTLLANGAPEMATDDWPFLYLEKSGIPGIYLGAMIGVSILITALLVTFHFATRRREVGRGGELLPIKLAFIFMGIAFLLLETKSVIQFSLLFGTTWLNNSLIFFAVLVSVLAANWTVQFVSRGNSQGLWLRIGFLYGLLAASVLITFVFPLHDLLSIEGIFPRFVAASFLTFLPIYFANLIFSVSFRDQEAAEHLFGWNLLGATFGGVLEYTGMAIGYNALSLIVLGCYTLVFVFLIWHKNAARRLRSA
jgi:hypothetical protein